MDIALTPRPRRARWIISGAVGLGVITMTLALARLKPAAPQAERSSLLIDVVKRGAMVFQVRGTGTLVPVDIRMITAQVPCKVERILLYPGTPVTEGSIIAELSSPELQQAAEDALWQMRRAEADYEVDHLNQQATLNAARANTQEAKAVLLATERLRKEGLQSDLDVLRARVKAEEVNGRMAAEEARMRLYENKAGQVGPARARLEQAKALYSLKREQVASLKVRAGMGGIPQPVPPPVGPPAMPGPSRRSATCGRASTRFASWATGWPRSPPRPRRLRPGRWG